MEERWRRGGGEADTRKTGIETKAWAGATDSGEYVQHTQGAAEARHASAYMHTQALQPAHTVRRHEAACTRRSLQQSMLAMQAHAPACTVTRACTASHEREKVRGQHHLLVGRGAGCWETSNFHNKLAGT